MKLKLISCNVFFREVCAAAAVAPHVIDAEFTELGEHARPIKLRETIQDRIDATEKNGIEYDAIILLFGICGNSTVGLKARKTRLVIPRAHDCCTILLGSRDKYKEHFSMNPSTPFSSSGYMERGRYFLRTEDGQPIDVNYASMEGLVEMFGEEDAKEIWETIHPELREGGDSRIVFIDIAETAHLGYAETFHVKAESEGRRCERIEGSLRLFHELFAGNWNPEEFLVVEPGQEIKGVYDWDEIVRAEGNHDK